MKTRCMAADASTFASQSSKLVVESLCQSGAASTKAPMRCATSLEWPAHATCSSSLWTLGSESARERKRAWTTASPSPLSTPERYRAASLYTDDEQWFASADEDTLHGCGHLHPFDT
ncbi:hypothetical protein DIPPA_20379 [Diplonema papillatum]|nr:hypothetical protein DIPPA_20379 [Diplonema papillatum]